MITNIACNKLISWLMFMDGHSFFLFDESDEIIGCCIVPSIAVRTFSSAAMAPFMKGGDLDTIDEIQ